MVTRNGTLWLIRGASGAGKSHLATILEAAFPGKAIGVSNDDYRYVDGKYVYDQTKDAEISLACLRMVSTLMLGLDELKRYEHIIVHNTFTRRWELDPYYELAEKFDWRVSEIVCNNRFPNVHCVPTNVVDKQWARFEL